MLGVNRWWVGGVRGALLGVAAWAAFAPAQAQGLAAERPLAWFVQGGSAGGGDTRSVTLGVTADWAWEKSFGIGLLTGSWEGAVGYWHTDTAAQPDRGVWQIGITPTARLYTSGARTGFFAEIGIGANVISPRYRRNDKEFSTKFNFGDHLGVGWRFGEQNMNEVSFRIEHFSNASIKKPNPGENFFQLRYARHFD